MLAPTFQCGSDSSVMWKVAVTVAHGSWAHMSRSAWGSLVWACGPRCGVNTSPSTLRSVPAGPSGTCGLSFPGQRQPA